MKSIQAGVFALVMFGAVGSASAVELRNLDQRNHTVKVTSPTLKKEYEFRSMTMSVVICVDKCAFEIEGIGTVYATRDDIVTIEPGKILATDAKTGMVTEGKIIAKKPTRGGKRTR